MLAHGFTLLQALAVLAAPLGALLALVAIVSALCCGRSLRGGPVDAAARALAIERRRKARGWSIATFVCAALVFSYGFNPIGPNAVVGFGIGSLLGLLALAAFVLAGRDGPIDPS